MSKINAFEINKLGSNEKFEVAYTRLIEKNEKPWHINKKMDEELQKYQKEVELKYKMSEVRGYIFPRVI